MRQQSHLLARLVLSLPLVAAVGGCAAPPEAQADVRILRLQRGQWQVVRIDGQAPALSSEQTLRLGGDGYLRGYAGCNDFVGAYSVDADRLSPGRLETHAPIERAAAAASPGLKPCTAAQQADERRFLGVLERVNAFALRDDGTLLLQAPGDHVIEARQR